MQIIHQGYRVVEEGWRMDLEKHMEGEKMLEYSVRFSNVRLNYLDFFLLGITDQ